MAEPYIGEIRLGGWNFAPEEWAFCDGSTLAISQYTALFELIGTTYGGNGTTDFQLPNLLGRVPIHQGSNSFGSYVIGQVSGEENVTLTTNQMPEHNHLFAVNSNDGTTNVPAGNYVAGAPLALGFTYASGAGNESMGSAIATSGGDQPHANVQPFQCITYIFSLFGIFPSQG